MAFRKCAEPGCAFHVPQAYPFDRCPWHLTPGSDPVRKVLVVAGAFALLAVGYGVAKAIEGLRTAQREEDIKAGQQRWREMAEERRKPLDSEFDKSQEKGPVSDVGKRAEGDT